MKIQDDRTAAQNDKRERLEKRFHALSFVCYCHPEREMKFYKTGDPRYLCSACATQVKISLKLQNFDKRPLDNKPNVHTPAASLG